MKILIITKNWLGDILFQLPAIEAIKRFSPTAEIVCMAPERCREILEAHPAVSRVIAFDEKGEHRSLWAKIGLIGQLRREKWDRAYLFHRSRTRAALMWLAGVRERIGYAHGRRLFLTTAIEEPQQRMHHVDYALAFVKQAGISTVQSSRYRFYFSALCRQQAAVLLQEYEVRPRNFMCFHIGANWEPKRWPASHFAELADLIGTQWNIPILVTGAGRDKELAGEVTQRVKQARVLSLVGKTSLGTLGALYEQALLLVSGDSGPMHIASGVGTPVLALFGPTDPALTGPRGVGQTAVLQYIPEGYHTPWLGKNLPEGGWVSHITPQQVIAAIKEKGWMESGWKLQNESLS
ncbi:MAG: lipopolysaccharide heptosyltransferase II [Candidatus Omnitrophota bacterium]|nr:lipopolysaccharide heptosyltransferase II [Candidatus Omnitrophota bacterium]